MIYTKEANFPYPILSNNSDSYSLNYFNLDVNINDDVDHYYFNIDYEIDSSFINYLINEELVQLILVIQTKDSKFFKLSKDEKQVKIKKTRISIQDRTAVQLHIQALETINFSDNYDLNSFYLSLKEDIEVEKFNLLGYSNIVQFYGNIRKPYSIFEKNLDETLKSDIKIELGYETIIIHYKHVDYQFNDLPQSRTLNNAYIYTGLTKALYRFIIDNGQNGEVDLYDTEEPENLLDLKLYNLMKGKNIVELNVDNIDEVIYLISDKIIERFSSAIRGVKV